MSTDDPNRIRSDIEATRSDLSANVNALAESVRPGNVAKRQVDKVTGTMSGLKDKVMGSVEDGADGIGSATHSTAHAVKDHAASAPAAATRGTRGNPLAAGLIAFGGGWLLGSVLPASNAEQRAAAAVKDKAQPLTEEITDAAKSVAADRKEPAKDAAEQVKASAADAARNVKDEAQATAGDVMASSKDAVDDVKSNY